MASIFGGFVEENTMGMYTDAAGDLGFSLYWDGHWCSEPWHESRVAVLLQLFPVAVVLVAWGQFLRTNKYYYI